MEKVKWGISNEVKETEQTYYEITKWDILNQTLENQALETKKKAKWTKFTMKHKMQHFEPKTR